MVPVDAIKSSDRFTRIVLLVILVGAIVFYCRPARYPAATAPVENAAHGDSLAEKKAFLKRQAAPIETRTRAARVARLASVPRLSTLRVSDLICERQEKLLSKMAALKGINISKEPVKLPCTPRKN
jgi:hypothetical protein